MVAKASRRRPSPLATEHHTEKPWERYRARESLRHRGARKEPLAFGPVGGSWSRVVGKSALYSGWVARRTAAYSIISPYSGKEPYTWEIGGRISHGSSMEDYQVLALPTDLLESLNRLSGGRGLSLTEFLRQVVERASAGLPYAGIVEDDDEELSRKVEEVLARLKK